MDNLVVMYVHVNPFSANLFKVWLQLEAELIYKNHYICEVWSIYIFKLKFQQKMISFNEKVLNIKVEEMKWLWHYINR